MMRTPVLAHIRPKQVVDFSTYNTQILWLTGAIISKANYNDKYCIIMYRIVKDSVMGFRFLCNT